MTAETTEKLAGQLDKLRVAAQMCDEDDGARDVDGYGWRGALVDYLEGERAELVGRLEHIDDNTHRILQHVGVLVDVLEQFRPMLSMFRLSGRAGGTTSPDWIQVGQTVRTARREARKNGRGGG